MVTGFVLAAALALASAPACARPDPQADRSATPATGAAALGRAIDAYIGQPQFARADWGIAVRSLDSGKVLYTHHADRLFVPASNVKLFTAGLALATLGGSTRIATTLYATTTHIGARGTLRGDLVLYGRGDPALGLPGASADWADQMARALSERGIHRIRGDLIADATYFSGTPVGGGWEANDLQTWFAAVPSALNVDGNVVRVTVTRTARQCCTIAIAPRAARVHIVNQTDDDAADPLGLYRPIGSSTLYATGRLPARTRKRTYPLSMPDPALAAGNLLREALARRGIALDGKVRVVRWPEADPALERASKHPLASVDSPTIAELVHHTLKDSDNLFAQSLLLQAGVAAARRGDCHRSHAPVSSAGWALCALNRLLASAGVPPGAVRLYEGSGLARHDLVTPNAFVQWLTWAMTQGWGPILRKALPIAGVDGTLQHRFRTGAAAGNLSAKTGTLNHDYTLTGFVTDAAGERLVFSILLNRYPRWQVAREFPQAVSPTHALDDVARMITAAGAR